MIVKRLAAAALAFVLITGAWIVRDRVIDGDTADADQPANAGVLVCTTELADLCRRVFGKRFDVVANDAGETLDRLATADADEAELWLTFDAFPQMMNQRRTNERLLPFEYTSSNLATSRLAAVVRPRVTDDLVAACGDPIDLGCLGEQTALGPAVSSVDSGLGLLAISAAFAARTDETFSPDDVDLLSWARGFQRASDGVALPGSTAVQTIQTKTTVRVAIGADAELASTRRDEFDVLYAAPMARVQVVLLKPTGFDVPENLVAEFSEALTARGWDGPGEPKSEPGALPSYTEMIGIREFWATL